MGGPVTGEHPDARALCLAGEQVPKGRGQPGVRWQGLPGLLGLQEKPAKGSDTQTPSTPGKDAETLCERELSVVASQMTAVLLGPYTAQEEYCKLCLEMSMLK